MWFKTDGAINHHPKLTAAGPVASWLYICGLAYATTYSTDGMIPDAEASHLTPLDDATGAIRRLVDTGLWHRCKGGYQIHDFLHYQQPAAKMKAGREAHRRHQAAYRARKNGASNGQRDAIGDASREVRVIGPKEEESDSELRVNPAPIVPTPPAPETRAPEPIPLRAIPKPRELERAAIEAHPLTAPLSQVFGPPVTRDLDGWRDDLAALDELGARPEDIPRAAIGYAATMGVDGTGRPIAMTRKALIAHWFRSLHAPLTAARAPTDGRMPVHGQLDPAKYLTGQYAQYFNRKHEDDDAYDSIGEASP